jgi:hypothetical protein
LNFEVVVASGKKQKEPSRSTVMALFLGSILPSFTLFAGSFGVFRYACTVGHTRVAVCFVVAAAYRIVICCTKTVNTRVFNAGYIIVFFASDINGQQGGDGE